MQVEVAALGQPHDFPADEVIVYRFVDVVALDFAVGVQIKIDIHDDALPRLLFEIVGQFGLPATTSLRRAKNTRVSARAPPAKATIQSDAAAFEI